MYARITYLYHRYVSVCVVMWQMYGRTTCQYHKYVSDLLGCTVSMSQTRLKILLSDTLQEPSNPQAHTYAPPTGFMTRPLHQILGHKLWLVVV
jgi:hypothetical protein